jgi:hypothetical protein
MVVLAGNAPASSGYQLGAGGRVPTPFELRDVSEFRLQSKPTHRAENDIHLPCWPNSHGANWFVAPAKEQLALVTNNGFHGISSG